MEPGSAVPIAEIPMTPDRDATYLEPTQESGRDFLLRGIEGEVVMLNLLRFRDVADYSATPELRPDEPISGSEADLGGMGHRLAAISVPLVARR